MKTVLTYTRPDNTTEWFTTAQITDEAKRTELNLWLAECFVKDVAVSVDEEAEDGLTLMRTITWGSVEIRENFDAVFNSKFPWFLTERDDYLTANGHTLLIETYNDAGVVIASSHGKPDKPEAGPEAKTNVKTKK
jgi:hypothetical protein